MEKTVKKMPRQMNCCCQFVCNSKVDNLSMIINFYNKRKSNAEKKKKTLTRVSIATRLRRSFGRQQQQRRRWLWLRDINHFISVAVDCAFVLCWVVTRTVMYIAMSSVRVVCVWSVWAYTNQMDIYWNRLLVRLIWCIAREAIQIECITLQ